MTATAAQGMPDIADLFRHVSAEKAAFYRCIMVRRRQAAIPPAAEAR
jgi:hypothetical protein